MRTPSGGARLIIITGPTGVGKNDLAYSLSGAHDVVLVNADSRQIYKEIPILTNQPTSEQLATYDHRLYGTISITSPYSAVKWVMDAEDIIDKTDKCIIVLGGTGLYINSLIYGLSDIPCDPEVRRMARQRMSNEGIDGIRTELFAKDNESARRLSPGDTQRIMRAYEVLKSSGHSIYTLRGQRKPAKYPASSFINIAVIEDRERLYNNADARFLQMLERGALEEAGRTRDIIRNAQEPLPASKTPGLSELIQFLDGHITLDKAIELAQRNTRRYIKRQLTWLRHQQKEFVVCPGKEEAMLILEQHMRG